MNASRNAPHGVAVPDRPHDPASVPFVELPYARATSLAALLLTAAVSAVSAAGFTHVSGPPVSP